MKKNKHGGARDNAGAPLKYGEPQIKVTIEVPISIKEKIKDYARELKKEILKELDK